MAKDGQTLVRRQVSIYIELDGLDDCSEDMFQATSNEKEVSLTITKAGFEAPFELKCYRKSVFCGQVAGRKRTFTLKDLANEIDGVKASRVRDFLCVF